MRSQIWAAADSDNSAVMHRANRNFALCSVILRACRAARGAPQRVLVWEGGGTGAGLREA